jgi:HAD superfamily hydrolase (TIGR01549 family)
MTIKGVLLDIDGTLVLSNDAHARAWVEAFAAYGHEIEFNGVRPLIGMGGDQIIPRLVPGLSEKEGEGKKIAERRKESIVNELGANLSPTKGARQLVEKLERDGYKLVISSSAKTEELAVLLEAARIDDLLDQDTATTSSDVSASKPDPDLIEATLRKGNLKADEAILLGDTPYDIQAATAAGVATIAFRSGGFPDESLAGAIAIYDDPADLLARYEESPLAKERS